MGVESKLAELETRLRAAEDQLEILRLLNSYGPLVDSGLAGEAAELWATGGGYDFGGGTRLEAPQDLVALYEADLHRGLVHTGVSHLRATPVRTPAGWRIKERLNRVLDGSPESHEIMRGVLPGGGSMDA